jgi:hypothetical protein
VKERIGREWNRFRQKAARQAEPIATRAFHQLDPGDELDEKNDAGILGSGRGFAAARARPHPELAIALGQIEPKTAERALLPGI